MTLSPGFNRKIRTTVGLFFLLILIGIFAINRLTDQFSLANLQDRMDFYRAFHRGSFFAAVMLFVLVRLFFGVVSIPGTGILTLIGGALFGLWLGFLLTLVATSTGILIAFLLTRYTLRDVIEPKLKVRFKKAYDLSNEHAASLLFFVRLVEVFPTFVINSFFAFTMIPARTFYLVSVLSIMPGIFIVTNAGARLGMVSDIGSLFTLDIILSFAAIGLVPLVSALIVKNGKKQKAADMVESVSYGSGDAHGVY